MRCVVTKLYFRALPRTFFFVWNRQEPRSHRLQNTKGVKEHNSETRPQQNATNKPQRPPRGGCVIKKTMDNGQCVIHNAAWSNGGFTLAKCNFNASSWNIYNHGAKTSETHTPNHIVASSDASMNSRSVLNCQNTSCSMHDRISYQSCMHESISSLLITP